MHEIIVMVQKFLLNVFKKEPLVAINRKGRNLTTITVENIFRTLRMATRP
jgi:hypothetical protein